MQSPTNTDTPYPAYWLLWFNLFKSPGKFGAISPKEVEYLKSLGFSKQQHEWIRAGQLFLSFAWILLLPNPRSFPVLIFWACPVVGYIVSTTIISYICWRLKFTESQP